MKRKKNNTEVQPKKAKHVEKEFTEVEFKFMLRDNTSALSGLENFIIAAQNSVSYDIVDEYCQSSPQGSEVLQLLELEKRKPGEVALIFSALEQILLRTADDLSQHKAIAQHIISRILVSRMGLIYFSMNMHNKSNHIKATLRFLTAIVMQGESAAKALLTQFDTNHTVIKPLFSRTDTKDPQDVRVCLLQFVVAFLLTGSDSLIRQLLNNRGFLNNIFDGLLHDRVSTIQLILPTLLEKVVQNPAVSKTAKVHVFTGHVVKCLGSLYQWKGMKKWSEKKTERDDSSDATLSEEEDQKIVLEIVHKFLLELCCSPKHGISFHDNSYGTSDKNYNPIITQFLASIKNILDSSQLQALVLDILRFCPDQIRHFLPQLSVTLEPRHSQRWLSAMDFICQIYRMLPDVPGFVDDADLSSSKIVEQILVFLVPPENIFNKIIQGLKHTDRLVRDVVLNYLSLILKKAAKIIVHLNTTHPKKTHLVKTHLVKTHLVKTHLDERELDKCTEVNLEMALKNTFSKLFPDLNTIFVCWEKVTSQQDVPVTTDSPHLAEDDHMTHVTVAGHMMTILDVLFEYQQLFPSVLSDKPTLILKLVSKVFGNPIAAVDVTAESDQVLPQLHLLKILADTDVQKLAFIKETKDGNSLLFYLFRLVARVQKDQVLHQTTQQLICKFLSGTGLFDLYKEEVTVWVRCLSSMNSENVDSVVSFVTNIFSTFISYPYPHIDKVTDLVSESLSLTLSHQTQPASTKKDSAIDAILEMDEEENISEDWILNPADSVYKLPFSPLSVIALETVTTKQLDLKTFLSAVLIDILHTMTDPLPLCLLVRKHRDCVEESVADYIDSWMSPHKVNLKLAKKLRKIKKPSVLLQCLYHAPELSSDESFTDRLERVLDDMAVEDALAIVKQVLLYLSTLINQQISTPSVVQCLFGVLNKMLHLMHSCKEQDLPSNLDMASYPADMTVKPLFDNLISAAIHILQHPTLEHVFFCGLGSVKQSSTQTSCPVEVTDVVVSGVIECLDLLTDIPKHDSLQEMVVSYSNKVLDCLCNGQINCNLTVTVLEKLCAFIDNYTGIIERFCDLPMSHLCDTDNGKLMPSALYLIRLIEKLDVCDSEHCLSFKVMQMIFTLMDHCQNVDLDAACYKLLVAIPQYALTCTRKHFLRLVDKPNERRMAIAASLLYQSPLVRMYCEDWLKTEKTTLKQRDQYIELVTAYVEVVDRSKEFCREEDEHCLSLVISLYQPSFDQLTSPTAQSVTIATKMCKLFSLLLLMDKFEKCYVDRFKMKLLKAVRIGKHITADYIHLLHEIDSHYKDYELDGGDSSVLVACMNCLMNSTDCGVRDAIFSNVKVKKCTAEVVTIWTEFLKITLRSSFTNPLMLTLLKKLAEIIYTEPENVSVSIATIYQMITSHSKFIDVMVDNVSGCREAIVDLLLVLVERSASCCVVGHIAVYLGAYSATLSITDQKILKLMHIYDTNGVNLEEHRPYFWGQNAIEQLGVRKTLGQSLVKQSTMKQVLETLDVKKMQRSSLHFPLRRPLNPLEASDAELYKGEDEGYDPCFLLPLFSHLLSPGSVVDCRKFVEVGGLGFVLSALSSHHAKVRTAACHVLSQFAVHLEGGRFPEKEQIMYLLKFVQNSLEKSSMKLACIITVFLSRAADLLLKPGDYMYDQVNMFLLLKPHLDVLNVPEFYKFFNSSDTQFKAERSWCLMLLSDGLRETADYRIFEKRYIFKLLQCFEDSSLSDHHTQLQVLKILSRACTENVVTRDLTKHHGFFPWLQSAIRDTSVSFSGEKMEYLVHICHNMWFTMLGPGKDGVAHVPVQVTKQMFLCLKHVLQTSRCSDTTVYIVFLKTLTSVLTHATDVSSPRLSLIDVCLLLFDVSRLTADEQTRLASSTILKAMGHKIQIQSLGNPRRVQSMSDKNHSHVTELRNLVMSACLHWKIEDIDVAVLSTNQVHVYCAGFMAFISWILRECQLSELATLHQIVSWMHKVTNSSTQVAQYVRTCLTLSEEGRQLTERIIQIYCLISGTQPNVNKNWASLYNKTLTLLNSTMSLLANTYADKHLDENDSTNQHSVDKDSSEWNLKQIRNCSGLPAEEASVLLRQFFHKLPVSDDGSVWTVTKDNSEKHRHKAKKRRSHRD